jgi:lipoyl synthase
MLTAQKPLWLDKTIRLSDCSDMKLLLRSLNLHTVCEEAACPNIGECFAKATAAFMILGRHCTRHCRFCNIDNGLPMPVDDTEPASIAEAAHRLGLRHIVVTSVTRDDLPDGGAGHFANTVSCIRKSNISVTIEVLVPDFNADIKSISIVVESLPDIINHNIETVPRLYPYIRPEADYERSLNVLKAVSEFSRGVIHTKSGIMLGFGEGKQEVLDVLKDLKEVGCQFLSIGQYLSPGRKYLPVKEYVLPELFEYYKIKAQDMGFKHVVSAPYARSSYLADEYIQLKSESEQ